MDIISISSVKSTSYISPVLMRSFGKMILYSCSSLKNSSLQNNTLYKYFELKEYFFPPSTLAKGEGLKEFVLFNMKDTTEYEANGN